MNMAEVQRAKGDMETTVLWRCRKGTNMEWREITTLMCRREARKTGTRPRHGYARHSEKKRLSRQKPRNCSRPGSSRKTETQVPKLFRSKLF